MRKININWGENIVRVANSSILFLLVAVLVLSIPILLYVGNTLLAEKFAIWNYLILLAALIFGVAEYNLK